MYFKISQRTGELQKNAFPKNKTKKNKNETCATS